jgi:hypothetical protein
VATHVAAASIPLEKAGQEIQSLRDQLVDHLTATFLEDSGVLELMQELDTRRSQGVMTRHTWLVEHLDDAAQRLDGFLSAALMDAQEAFKSLLDRALSKHVVAEAAERFCAEFDELEAMLDMIDAEAVDGIGEELQGEVDGQLPLLRDLYTRTGAEVRALLS